MSALTDLLLLPVAAPVKGLIAIARHIDKEAHDATDGPDAIRRQLMELNREFDAGLLPEEEFEAREADLIRRLRAAKADERSQHGNG